MFAAQAAAAQVQATSNLPLASTVMQEQLAKHKETLGQFKPYDAQLTIPDIAGTRIAKLLYQVNKKTGTKAAENSYVRLPIKHLSDAAITEQLPSLLPHIHDWLASIEDLQIRESHKKGQLNVFTDGLSIAKLVEVLESSGNGERLNKDKIAAWFKEYMQEGMEDLVATKLGITAEGIDAGTVTQVQIDKIDMIVRAYKVKFESLAGGKTALPDADCLAMIDVIGKVAGAGDSILGEKFVARLTKMMEKEKEEELLLML